MNDLTIALSQPDPYSKINEAFGIEAAEKIIEPLREYPVINSDEYPVTVKQREDDFATIRATLQRVLQKAEDSLDSLTIVAKSSESPRSYEVVSTMINTVSTIASDLIQLHEKKAKLEGATSVPPIGNVETLNNVVFSGSSTELLNMLKNGNKVN